jgi:hypothetical protein
MKAEFLFWLLRRWALFAFCFSMVTALSAEAGKEPSSSPAIPVKRHLRFDDTIEVLSTVSAAYVRGRIDALNKQEGLYAKTRARLRRLLDAGYDPTLLDECLYAPADDAIVVGMWRLRSAAPPVGGMPDQCRMSG